tara:strand:+ start:912 stop:1796 length:885 start_codon:yes stop_codon:yes gene_type:complete
MSRVTIGKLGGIATSLGQVTLPSGHTLTVNGDIFHHNSINAMKVPTGTTAQRPGSASAGYVRFNTTENFLEVYTGSEWKSVIGPDAASTSTLGTQSNPAISGMAIKAEGLPSGLYWIKPNSSNNSYKMYVDCDRNGGGWVLTVHARTSTCQDHMNQGAVRISNSLGPRFGNTSTCKVEDSWMNAMVSVSTYSGSTRYWMEAHGFANPVKNMFIDSNATVDLLSSASNQNARTRVSTSYEGSLSDRGPNTGTRGFGDHHTSGGTYYAYGRHPESGNNCGFRSDNLGASNGYLWIK